MRLTLYKLTQLAVSAKILCLLMVMSHFCGVAMEDVMLFSDSGKGYIRVNENGRVVVDVRENFLNITTSSIGNGFNSAAVLLYDTEKKMFICFDKKWKLVGRKYKMERAGTKNRCKFKEKPEGKYVSYFSAINPKAYIGFNKRGNLCYKRTSKCPDEAKNFFRKGRKSIKEHNEMVNNNYHDEMNLQILPKHPRRHHHLQNPQQQMLQRKQPRPDRGRHPHVQRNRA